MEALRLICVSKRVFVNSLSRLLMVMQIAEHSTDMLSPTRTHSSCSVGEVIFRSLKDAKIMEPTEKLTTITSVESTQKASKVAIGAIMVCTYLYLYVVYNSLQIDVGWVGGGCDHFDWQWANDNGCTPGDCPFSFNDFRAQVRSFCWL